VQIVHTAKLGVQIAERQLALYIARKDSIQIDRFQ
jgi:hypothetical protein